MAKSATVVTDQIILNQFVNPSLMLNKSRETKQERQAQGKKVYYVNDDSESSGSHRDELFYWHGDS